MKNNDDDLFLRGLNKPRNGPWHTITLVITVTLIAVWLVPEEEQLEPLPPLNPMKIADHAIFHPPESRVTAKTYGEFQQPESRHFNQPEKTGQSFDDIIPLEPVEALQPLDVIVKEESTLAALSPLPTDKPLSAPRTPGALARELIRQLDAAPDGDLNHAVTQARKQLNQGHIEDAYLLYFYAARYGHQEAAFTLAQHADPAHDQTIGLFPQADMRQALKWYQRAAQAGHAEAGLALERLQASLETAAQGGDPQAQRLLLQWR
jgi:hypothetical protein